MQDLARMYKRRYEEVISRRILRKIRRIIQSDQPPMIILAAITFLVIPLKK